MENGKSPSWLQELLDQTEERDQHHLLEINKLRADQALAAIAVIEDEISEVEQIAQQEIDSITNWAEEETRKHQNKINWICYSLEKYIRSTGDNTINLAHGAIKLRKSRDKVDIIDLQKFIPIGQRLGLVRRIEEKFEPDMNAIRAYLKTNGNRPPNGVILTPGQPTFSYTTIKKGLQMANQNGQKPKVELVLNESKRLTLLRKEPITGKQTNGDAWQLYPVKDEAGNELSFFAPDDIHSVLVEHKLRTGDEFIVTRVENGKKGSSKLQVSIIGKESTPAEA